jgi:uncharacterized protein YjbI with pentapeptide repeats
MTLKQRFIAGAVALALAGSGLTGADVAIATTPSPTYTACVSSVGGILYNVTTNGTPTCDGRNKTITWDQTGPQGLPGANGTDGTDGNTILNGAGAPASGVGSNGDFYVDTANDTLYGPKAVGAWPATGTSLVGPAGVAYDCSATPYPGIDLASCQLKNANLTLTDLIGANLTSTNLTSADLANANLYGAYMYGSDLYGADLNSADLNGVSQPGLLQDANLTWAAIEYANLTDTNFNGATMTEASLIGSNLTNANLDGVTGLISADLIGVTWSSTTCPDGTNSNNDGGTCVNNLG